MKHRSTTEKRNKEVARKAKAQAKRQRKLERRAEKKAEASPISEKP
jgi:hypothetical protein